MRNLFPVFLATLSAGAALLLPACAPAPAGASAVAATPNPPRLQIAAFTSPQQGYGLFYRNGGRVCSAEVAATTDGGRRFGRPRVAVTRSCDASLPVSELTADAAGDVFAFGPGLTISHDHGRSWNHPRFGDVLAVAAVGRSVWLLAAARCSGHGGVPDTCPVRLLVSADGGRSWRPARLPGAFVPGFGQRIAGQADLVRTGRAVGYVLTSPGVNPRGQADAATILITRNGGAAWSRHRVNCGIDAPLATLAVAPAGTIFVACAAQPAAGSQVKTLASSPDGRSWTVRTPCARGQVSCPPLSFGYLSQIAATSSRTVFLVGPRSSLLVTHDAGRHWQAVRPQIGDDGGGTASVAFFGSRGIVIGDDTADNELPAIWHTTDAGATWHVIHPVIP